MYNLPQKHIHLNVDYPPCCTRQPLPGSAFCEEHSNTVSQLGFKTSLRGFLKDCGISGIDNKCWLQINIITLLHTIDLETFNKEKSDKVDDVLRSIHKEAKKKKIAEDASFTSKNTPVHEQGTAKTLRPKGSLDVKKINGHQESTPSCNKETVGMSSSTLYSYC